MFYPIINLLVACVIVYTGVCLLEAAQYLLFGEDK